MSEGDASTFVDRIKRPRRGPNTRKTMHRDYHEFWSNLPSPQTGNILSPVREAPSVSEDCYTCGFPLDRAVQEGGEKVVRCRNCNEAEIHESCLRACRRCEELE